MAISTKVMTQHIRGKVIEFTDFLEPNNENDSNSLVLAFTDHTLLRIDGVSDYNSNITNEMIASVVREGPGLYAMYDFDDHLITEFSCNDREVRVFDGTWRNK